MEARPEIQVEADLAISVDDVDAHLRGRGTSLELVSEHPWRFTRSAVGGGTLPAALRAARAAGVEVRLTGPRGAVATLGAGGVPRPAPRVVAGAAGVLLLIALAVRAVSGGSDRRSATGRGRLRCRCLG